MIKFKACISGGVLLAACCGLRADDAPPTPPEMVGYALSLADRAYHGDKGALELLQSNAARQDAQAEFGLGELSLLNKDYAQSISWFQKSAGQRFAGAYYALGAAYEAGQGVPRDYRKAMSMYLKAMDQLPSVQTNVGSLYERGLGVKRDYAQAASWYRKAAEAGDIEADMDLASLYVTGQGVPQDDSQAAQWYRKAADLRNMLAQYRLGLLYEQSKSIQDYQQAVHWYGLAAQQGVADAQLRLGLLYSSGKGVASDAARALNLFQMAANQGDGQAQYQLASCFAAGKGIRPDPFRAYQWMTIAQASLDVKDPTQALATEKLKELEKQLSPTQVSQAKKAAADWQEANRRRLESIANTLQR